MDSERVTDAILELCTDSSRHTVFHVTGDSMSPVIRDGDRVIVTHCPVGVRRGSVVLFRRPHGLVAHRVLRVQESPSGRQFLTKGDNLPHCDPPLRAADVVGRVLAVQRNRRTMSIDNPAWRAAGWLVATAALASTALYGRASMLKKRFQGPRANWLSSAVCSGLAAVVSFSLKAMVRVTGRWVESAPDSDDRS